MADFNQNPQGGKPRNTQPVGGFLDQLKGLSKSVGKSAFEDLLAPLPAEALKQMGFGTEVGPKREQVLFDGTQARKDAEKSQQEAKNQQKIASLQQELAKMVAAEQQLSQELSEISQTIVSVAKAAEIEVPAGIEQIPAKPGKYHKVFFARILEDVRKKADEAKEWRRAQQVRVTSKPARGAQIWLGDQKKAQEAGAMFLLQG